MVGSRFAGTFPSLLSTRSSLISPYSNIEAAHAPILIHPATVVSKGEGSSGSLQALKSKATLAESIHDEAVDSCIGAQHHYHTYISRQVLNKLKRRDQLHTAHAIFQLRETGCDNLQAVTNMLDLIRLKTLTVNIRALSVNGQTIPSMRPSRTTQ